MLIFVLSYCPVEIPAYLRNLVYTIMKITHFALLVLLALTSCLSNSAQEAMINKTVPANEFRQLTVSKKGAVLVDVRTPAEFAEDHLPNAINIDYNAGDFQTKMQQLDKSKPVLIYCLSGGRSGKALQWMGEAGFREVYNLKGGILQWKAGNLPLTTTATASGWQGMSKEEYRQLTSGDIPVVVDFNAPWCGPCKQLKPILEEIQKEYAGKIKIVPINIDQHKSLARSMYVNNIPLLIYYENGQPKINQEGFLDKEGLLKLFGLKK